MAQCIDRSVAVLEQLSIQIVKEQEFRVLGTCQIEVASELRKSRSREGVLVFRAPSGDTPTTTQAITREHEDRIVSAVFTENGPPTRR